MFLKIRSLITKDAFILVKQYYCKIFISVIQWFFYFTMVYNVIYYCDVHFQKPLFQYSVLHDCSQIFSNMQIYITSAEKQTQYILTEYSFDFLNKIQLKKI